MSGSRDMIDIENGRFMNAIMEEITNSSTVIDTNAVVTDFKESPLGKLLAQVQLYDRQDNALIGLTCQTLHDILCITLFTLKHQLCEDRVSDICGIKYDEVAVEAAMTRLISIAIKTDRKPKPYTYVTVRCRCGKHVKIDVSEAKMGGVQNKARCPECTRFIRYKFNSNDEVYIPEEELKNLDSDLLNRVGGEFVELDSFLEGDNKNSALDKKLNRKDK